MLTFTIMCPIKVNMIKYQDESNQFYNKRISANNEKTFCICDKIKLTCGSEKVFFIVTISLMSLKIDGKCQYWFNLIGIF